MVRLTITARVLPEGKPFTVIGRDAWALLELHRAGSKGCTPIDNPAPRWSAYIHALRHERGLNIESHGSAFAGSHARYVLRSPVVIEVLAEPRVQAGRRGQLEVAA